MGYEAKKLIYEIFAKYEQVLRYRIQNAEISEIESALGSEDFAQYQLTTEDLLGNINKNLNTLLGYAGIEGEGDYNFMVATTKVAAGNLALVEIVESLGSRVNIQPTNCNTDLDTAGVTDFWFGFGDFFSYAFGPELQNDEDSILLQSLYPQQVQFSGTSLPPEEVVEGLIQYTNYIQDGDYQRVTIQILRNDGGEIQLVAVFGGPFEGGGKDNKWSKEGKDETGSVSYAPGDSIVVPGSQAGFEGQDGVDDVTITFIPGSIIPIKTGGWQDCFELQEFPLIDTSSGIDFTSTWKGCNQLRSSPDGEIVGENIGEMKAVYDTVEGISEKLAIDIPYELYENGVTWELYKIEDDEEILVTTSDDFEISPPV
jgi:hypothetical protein